MGSGAGKPTRVDLESNSGDKGISVSGNSANRTNNEFTVPINTLVSSKGVTFQKKTRIKISIKDGGVLRIGLTTINPSENENILPGSVFEKEEGFSSEQSESVRVLYKTSFGCFCYGPEGEEIEYGSESSHGNLWLYIIFVYGTQDVKAELSETGTSNETLALSPITNGSSILPNTATCRISKPIIVGDVYHCKWDMKLPNESIGGKSPSHGYMGLKIVSRKGSGDVSQEELVWARSSAVLEYPFSSVIAFRLSLHERQVSHNLLVNSVGNTAKDNLNVEESLDTSSLYLVIEFSSGEIEVTHGKRLIIAQGLGSTILVNDYTFDDEQATFDEAITEIMSKIDFKPRRLQYGHSPTTFVLEFNERLTENDLRNIQRILNCKVQRIQETKSVQILIDSSEKVEQYDIKENFSRTRSGGGKIKDIEMKVEIPGCWMITFYEEETARNVWMMKKHSLIVHDRRVNASVLPVYSELGLAVNGGEKPVSDLTPLTVDVDETKLRFIKSKDNERKSFEAAINKKIKVNVIWEAHSNAELDDDFGEDSPEEYDHTSITFEYCGPKSDWKKSTIWKDITKKEVSSYFQKSIHQVKFSFEDDRRDDILFKLNSLHGQYSFVYEEDDEKMEITLYGSNEGVLKEVAGNAGKRVVIPEVITESVEISVHQYLTLDAEGILNIVKTECQNTSFKINTGTGIITLKGPTDEVKAANRRLLNFALKIESIKLPVSRENAQFLRNGGMDLLKDLFRKEKINYNISLSETEHTVHVMTYIENGTIETKKKKMLDIIKNLIHTCTLNLDKETDTTFTAAEWKHCKDDIDEKTKGLVAIFGPTNNQITIIGTKDTVTVAKAQIYNYLRGHKLRTIMMHVPVDIAEYLDEFKSDDIRDKIECMKNDFGWYTGKLSLKCSADDLTHVQKVVEKEIKEIKQHWFYMNEKWIASVIQDLVDLQTLSHNERFLLQIEIGHTLADQGIICVDVFAKSGSIIQVKQGDITIETSEAIVHSTNGHSKAFERGVGKCLQNIGGNEIKEELLRTIEKQTVQRDNNVRDPEEIIQPGSENEGHSNSGFKPGEIIVTGSGRLSCLKVIHVYPPKWIDGTKSEDKALKALVKKILQTCQTKKLASVSLSAIGCGAGGYPEDKATLHIVEAVVDFIENTKDLVIKEVVLCDASNKAVNKFKDALEKFKKFPWFFFKHGQKIQLEDFLSSSIRKAEGKAVIRPTSSRNTHEVHAGRPTSALKWGRQRGHGHKTLKDNSKGKNGDPELTELFKDGLPYHIPITDNLTLHVVKGDVTMQEVNAIVNPTPEFPNISGEISKAIVTAGGSSIRQECQNRGTISEGEIQITGAGNLKCQEIIHARIPVRWNSQNGEQLVGGLVSNCISEANKRGFSSIAFPTIGTGNSGFPADKVANAMVKSICEVGKESSSLTDVFIVVYTLSDGICKIFEDVIPHCFNSDTNSMAGRKISKKGSVQIPRRKNVKYVSPTSFEKHSIIDDVVVFKIISKTNGIDLQKKIQKVVKEHIITEKVNFQEMTNEETLSEVEERTLKMLKMNYGVTIVIDKKLKCVVITGLPDRVKNCHFEVVKLLRDTFPTRRMKERNVKTIGDTVQWYYGDADGNSQPVDAVDNYEIHIQYLGGQDFTYFNHSDKKTYKVIINEMKEHPTDAPQKRRRLYLRTKVDESIPLPDTWTIIMDDNLKIAQVKLKEADSEFNDVKNKFIKGGCRPKKIESITRLENKFLWQQYQTKKKLIEAQNIDNPNANERNLWHGTDSNTVPKILKNGYDRSFTTTAAYGIGAYFAVDSSYSDNDRYAAPDANGVKRMFLSRVLVGYSCIGNSSMYVLPVRKQVNNMPVCYDTAADSDRNPKIYVIFHDTQAYPEYLIEYS